MQQVIRAQQSSVAGRCDSRGQQSGMSVSLLSSTLSPHAERIQHRRNARGRKLPVIGDDGGNRIPEHLWTRHEVRFEVVSVQLDQAWHDEVAIGLLAARGCSALTEFGDPAVSQGDPAIFDHAIRKHDFRVADYGFLLFRFHHHPSQAIAANDVTSTNRSAIAFRISSS